MYSLGGDGGFDVGEAVATLLSGEDGLFLGDVGSSTVAEEGPDRGVDLS